MKRHILPILLTLLISMGSTRAIAYDIAVENADGITIYYNYTNEGKELEVAFLHEGNSNSLAYSNDLVIPEDVSYMNRSRKVTGIGYYAFANCSNLTTVTIPNSVTIIGDQAFAYCTRLTSISIGNNVTSIGNYAFLYCTSLTSVPIPNSVASIGAGAFYGCNSITTMNIPNNVATIEQFTFYECSGLNSVSIPNNVTSIGTMAMYGCSSLTSLSIPENVTSIGQMAFEGCSSLVNLIIPDNVFSIGLRAFYGCSSLTSVTIGKSVTSIGERAFDGADISTIVSLIARPYAIIEKSSHERPFSLNTFNNATLYVAKGTVDKHKSTTGWKDFLYIEEGDYAGTYKLTYMVDGEVFKLYDVVYGTTITPEAEPQKEGYSFLGWSEIPETMPAEDVIVEGSFAINKYILTYKVNDEEYKTYEVEYGATIIPEPAPTKEGYTFSGWREIPEAMPAHDVTVTGTFTINKYKLTYMVDDNEYKTNEVEYGTKITPESEPTKEGYTFSGWSEIPETMPAHDVTVTGSFAINKYKLIYKIDDAEYKTYEIEFDATITPETEPTKKGYTFSGWSWIPTKMPAEDVTITGSFTVNQYTITYIIGNEVYTMQTVDYGSVIIPPTTPEREGYDFAWGDYPETMPAHDITIYGTYTTGIEVIMAGEANCPIFSLEGKPLNEPQKGVNIVRMSNGQVRKVVVK